MELGTEKVFLLNTHTLTHSHTVKGARKDVYQEQSTKNEYAKSEWVKGQ